MNPAMRVAISGSSGLIGSALINDLTTRGWRVHRLIRTELDPGGDAIAWSPAKGRLDPARLEGIDSIVNLAGESLAGHRWTARHKRRVVESRINSTGLLARTIATLREPPRVFVSASGIGYYGNRGDEELTEESSSGEDFLAGLCVQWESAARPASDAGTRVAFIRTGMVLSPMGGALAKMLPPFRWGLGGPMGSGHQYMSWITLQDEIRAIRHIIETPTLTGPVNLAAPNPVTNREFASELGRVLSRPAIVHVPAFALRLLLGEMAQMVLDGQRARPARLMATGFNFQHPDLRSALATVLERER